MQILQNPPNQMFEDYVYHSLLYYGLDSPEIQDYTFDMLCHRLVQLWDKVDHPDKGLTDLSSLKAGTGFQMQYKWPLWAVKRARAAGYEHWALDQVGAQTTPKQVIDVEPELVIRTPSFKEQWIEAYAGIGSRETPDDCLALMRRIGKFQCDRGQVLRSGGADGADDAFHQGALESEKFCERSVEIYLPWNGFKREGKPTLWHEPGKGIYNAGAFENFEQAQEIGLKARGGERGLKQGGIKLHSRNAYQALGRDLKSPAKGVIFWAKPLGKNKWSGGTNTALQIALEYGIPMYNLYVEEQRRHLENFMENYRKAA